MKRDRKNVPVSGDYEIFLNKSVYAEVSPGATCLDVGCWKGALGKVLIADKKCIVDGIDVQEGILKQAKKNGYRHTFRMNLNNEIYDVHQIKDSYDVIICADILEHLIDPEFFLEKIKRKLKKNGKIIISVPNVAFILNRLLLLLGKWDYKEYGTLDKTHVRFFTIKSAKKMIESAGFTPIKVRPYNQFGVMRYINPIDSMLPGLFCYQILFVASVR